MTGKRFTNRIQPMHRALWNELITSVVDTLPVAGHDVLKSSTAVVKS